MKNPVETSRLIVFFAMLVLIAACIHTAFDTSRRESIKELLVILLFLTIPLAFIASATLHAERKALSFISAFIALGVGGFVEYQYYSYPSPSNVYLLALSILTYWASTIVAYFSYE